MSTKPNTTVDHQIGHRIRAARVDASMTQSELGDHLGCSSQQVHKYERGTNRVSAGTLFLIAQTLGHSVDWFFIDAEQSDVMQVHAPFVVN
ncbi:MAG: helix-turn-helix transcriptional regulator [Pseudomonadota bacterium]